jgi:hypothetical protein
MSIIITQPGQKARRLEPSEFGLEDGLQRLILETPEAIPLDETGDGVRLLVIAREWPTESGPIDALGLDGSGSVYVIETKLIKNPDKRTVIAQALDYGASLWRHGSDWSEFERRADAAVRGKFGVGLREKLAEFFEIDEAGVDALLESARRNLTEGRFKFIVPMDRLHDRLRDLIVYVNQNSRFDVYAVEIERYKLDDREIIIPTLFGAEVRKEFGQAAARAKTRWDEASFLAEAGERLSGESLAALTRLYGFLKSSADDLKFGTGSYGSVNPVFAVVSPRSMLMLGTDGRLNANFDWIREDAPDAARRLKEGLERAGLKFAEGWERTRPGFAVAEWASAVDAVESAVRDAV